MNTWPGGHRHAMDQSEHEKWNATHYPGTRQLCDRCGAATGRCEEDSLRPTLHEVVCEDCYNMIFPEEKEVSRE